MALVRLVVLGFIVLSVIYLSVSFWSRAVRRDKLKTEWEERGRVGSEDAFVRAGLEEYDRSFRKRLILAVYIIPAILAGLMIYLVNYA